MAASGDSPAHTNVFFIRHGESEANVHFYRGEVDAARNMLDPSLSAKGFEQARATAEDAVLADAFASAEEHGEVLVVVSPLRRTIQTAMGALHGWLDKLEAAGSPARVAFAPDIQETGEVLCDTGRPPAEIREEFADSYPFLPYHDLPEGWHLKEGPYRDTGPVLASRLTSFTKWVQDQPEKTVIVVAHHNVFLALLGVTFLNCEVRHYRLHDNHDVPTAGDLPLRDTWVPCRPLVSQTDSDLSPQEVEWLANPTIKAHCHEKLERWGYSKPERLR